MIQKYNNNRQHNITQPLDRKWIGPKQQTLFGIWLLFYSHQIRRHGKTITFKALAVRCTQRLYRLPLLAWLSRKPASKNTPLVKTHTNCTSWFSLILKHFPFLSLSLSISRLFFFVNSIPTNEQKIIQQNQTQANVPELFFKYLLHLDILVLINLCQLFCLNIHAFGLI